MTVQPQPTAKQYSAQIARVQAIRDYIAGSDVLISHALGSIAIVTLGQVLVRAAAAPAGSTQRIACFSEMQAIPQVQP